MSGSQPHRLSTLSRGLRGSAILGIAAEVRQAQAAGASIVNLTVGDFAPQEFSIPAVLRDALAEAIRAGETNYPPSSGVESLRSAIQQFYRASFGREHPTSQILVMAGARPAIYAFFRAVVDPGESVVFGVPSWNTESYVALVSGRETALSCDASTNFFPTAAMLEPVIRDARVVALNSPLNPTGTVIGERELGDICDLILAENARRAGSGRPLYLLYDQVYWALRFGGVGHADPIALRPAMSEYTVLVDAISKSFAATGLRVGWAVGPDDIIKAMADISTHAGAWAPRPEQVATARLLCNESAMVSYIDGMREAVNARLSALGDGIKAMKADGLPVDCLSPQGAIYLSARFALHGRTTAGGQRLDSNEDIRRYLLEAAGMAVVPFQAFGAGQEDGWFRLSVGAVSVDQIAGLMPRLRQSIQQLR